MTLTQIGQTSRPHGTRGELSLHVEEHYEEDLLRAKAILIGNPGIPYFVKSFRTGGKLTVTLETFTTREQVVLLSNKPLWLPTDQVTEYVAEPDTPWDELVGYTIRAEGYPDLGPIEDIMDLPQHYLAQIIHEEKTIYIPLHEDLVEGIIEEEKILVMDLPFGLLDLG